MTAHVHDSSTHHTRGEDGAVPAGQATGSTRPRWLLPALVGGVAVAVLVAYGVLPLSAVLYGGLFGGMLLMHVGGHGGHGGHGGPEGGTPTATEDLRGPSGGSSPDRTGFDAGPDQSATNEPNRSETHADAQRNSHGCH